VEAGLSMRPEARCGIGILGAGWVAAKYPDACRRDPSGAVVDIYSPSPGKATSLAEAHGLTVREYETEDQLFGDELVQIVVSATPSVDPCAGPDPATQREQRVVEPRDEAAPHRGDALALPPCELCLVGRVDRPR
jgi:hypothetical protein